jgi:hypothetical protein
MGQGRSRPVIKLEPICIDGHFYNPYKPNSFSCSYDTDSRRSFVICFRARISFSGGVFPVSNLFYPRIHSSIFIPSCIETIEPAGPGYRSESAIRDPTVFPVTAFEWGSPLHEIDLGLFQRSAIRALCVPASVTSFRVETETFSPSLRVLTFEPGSHLRRIDGLCFRQDLLWVLFPASLKHIDVSVFLPQFNSHPRPQACRHTFGLEAGNPHFTIAACTFMNSSRTSVIRYIGGDAVLTLDSRVKELGPRSFQWTPIQTLTFPEPCRVRFIRKWAFAVCSVLTAITIPSTVREIGEQAFWSCRMLQEVRIATGSKLRLIGGAAFDDCSRLDYVDVPSGATIRGHYEVLGKVHNEDGSVRTRVRFSTLDYEW